MMLRNSPSDNLAQPLPRQLRMVFNDSQHVPNVDAALNQIKRLYKITKYEEFKPIFCDCIRKLLESESNDFFKTSCDFLHKFLKHLNKLADTTKDTQATLENSQPQVGTTKPGNKKNLDSNDTNVRGKAAKGRGRRRKVEESDDSEDEIVPKSFLNSSKSTNHSCMLDDESDEISVVVEPNPRHKRRSVVTQHTITVHDRLISDCISIIDLYAEAIDDTCRFNSLYFMSKYLSDANLVDESIFDCLKATLSKRIRDKNVRVRAQAVIAAKTFQDYKYIREGYLHHFYRDPRPEVRKELVKVMDVNKFGPKFLIDATLDTYEGIRKTAFIRLSKIQPDILNQEQLHAVLHNGFAKRSKTFTFRSHTLQEWLPKLYDGHDLYQLLGHFNVIEYNDDIKRLLEHVYKNHLDNKTNNGTSSQLHEVVEHFCQNWLTNDKVCNLQDDKIDEKVIVIWLSLIDFCKSNSNQIQRIKLQPITTNSQADESIEEILDSQERHEEVIDLYERLMPDLVCLIRLIDDYVRYANNLLQDVRSDGKKVARLEFIYQQLMSFSLSYEIGDEVERKTVQETFDTILREDLLINKFESLIPPITKSLYHLVYSQSSNLMIDYIGEMIHNVRSHLEDIASSQTVKRPPTKRPSTNLVHSTIKGPAPKVPKSLRRVTIREPYESSEDDYKDRETRMGAIRVELCELQDELDLHVKNHTYVKANAVHQKIKEKEAELAKLKEMRSSNILDISRMSLPNMESEQDMNDKLHSTMLNNDLNDSNSSSQDVGGAQSPEVGRVFQYHPNELLKCLQMYFGCLQSVKVDLVPETMLNQLNYLNLECLNDCFKNDTRIKSLMVDCNGLTAFLSKEFALKPETMELFYVSCYQDHMKDMRTSGFKSLVEVVCRYKDIEFDVDKVVKFLNNRLCSYGKYDSETMSKSDKNFVTALIEGTAKLFYHKRICSPEVLAHFVVWWYHPRTPSRLKQFIGVFLETFVIDLLSRRKVTDGQLDGLEYLRELLPETFVLSIEYQHNYLRGPGQNIMDSEDMHRLIEFLCRLVPASLISNIHEVIDRCIDDSDRNPDLVKYYKKAKSELAAQSKLIRSPPPSAQPINESRLFARPIDLFD